MNARRFGWAVLAAVAVAAVLLAADGRTLSGRTDLQLRAVTSFAGFAMLLIALLPGLQRTRQVQRSLVVLSAVLGVAAFYNFGFFGHRNDDSFVNYWEQFHYQLGSKYFPELGFDGLYVASLAAQREADPDRIIEEPVRDLRTNELTQVRFVAAHEREVVTRFEPGRWAQFVADHHRYLESTEPWVIGGIRKDHGYNPPPSWTFVARLFVAHLASDRWGLSLLASLDVLLLALMFGVVFRTWGARVGCLCLALFGLAYGWRYMFVGALLRLDWLAASVIGICMLERRRPALAGALFGYAAAVRLFPVLLLAGPGLVAVRAWIRGERPRWAVRLVAGFVAALLVALLAGSWTGRGTGAWSEFVSNIELHRATWPPNRVGIDGLVLYGPHVVRHAAREWSDSRRLPFAAGKVAPLAPREIDRALADRTAARVAIRIVFLLLFAAAVVHATPAAAAAMSVAAIFALIPMDNYYWILLLTAPLAGGTAATLCLLLLAAVLYGVDLLHPGMVTRHLLMSVGIAGVLLVWLLPAARRSTRRADPGNESGYST